jgi:2-C-methyl-D-erythritol 2,4-cyclodiphosphate synthase
MTGRVGLGFDSHPFAAGRPLKLGGIEVPYNRGLRGHSDGDALLHAVADAVLGAAGLGSLGQQFPDTEAKWRGADSAAFVRRAREMAADRGFAIGNVDAVVICEAPKIAPVASKIQARIAELLAVPAESISIRGTSTNGLGFVGRAEGLAAMAVVLLLPK